MAYIKKGQSPYEMYPVGHSIYIYIGHRNSNYIGYIYDVIACIKRSKSI